MNYLLKVMSTGVKLSTGRKWDFDCLGYELNEEGCVSKIYCKTCWEYYLDDEKQSSTKSTGSVNVLVDTTKNKDHQTSLVRLKEKKLLAQLLGRSNHMDNLLNLNPSTMTST